MQLYYIFKSYFTTVCTDIDTPMIRADFYHLVDKHKMKIMISHDINLGWFTIITESPKRRVSLMWFDT